MEQIEDQRKLAVEVGLLRKLCRSLDEQRRKSHQEAVEWQNFGRFTAAVLQKEAETFERKLRVLQERLEGLARENGELQEMCLYLDKSREKSSSGEKVAGDGGGTLGSGKRTLFQVPVHSMCAEEMTRDPGPPLEYVGITSGNTLRDKKTKTLDALSMKDPRAAVTVLQKRLEKVESEKLELVKSLSAAHLLTARDNFRPAAVRPDSRDTLQPPPSVEDPALPLEFQSLLDSCRNENKVQRTSSPSPGLSVSADMIMQAITLLDMCRRLDAVEASGLTDPVEKKEVAILRVLMSIAWQKLQEESRTKL